MVTDRGTNGHVALYLQLWRLSPVVDLLNIDQSKESAAVRKERNTPGERESDDVSNETDVSAIITGFIQILHEPDSEGTNHTLETI